MSEGNGGGVWPVVQTVLLAGVLVASAMVTCSNDAVERRLIALEKAVARGVSGSSSVGPASAGGPAAGSAPVASAGGGSGGTAAATRPAGAGSGVLVTGWGDRKAEVTYVEGAPADAPLTLSQKRRPQADVYVNRRPSAPKSLNYYTSNEGETNTQTNLILHRMIGINPDDLSKVEPWLATRWEVSDDKHTYTYHLRRGVQHADGRPFTAADVKFSWDVMLNPSVRADHLRGGIEDIESLTTPDEFTVVVRYKRLYWAGLLDIGFGLKVLNKGWYEAEIPGYARRLGIEKYSTDPTSPDFGEVFNKIRIPCPGTGPYYVPNDDAFSKERLVMVQNPFWYGIQLYGDRYNQIRSEVVFIQDDVVADEEFKKGNFDVQVVEADRWDDQLQHDPAITKIAKHFVYDHMGLGYRFVAWNCRKPPFDDPRVRRAMTHLFDREWIVKEIQRGRGAVATVPTKPAYSHYPKDIAPWPYDPARAREILEEAGWRDTNGDGVLDKDGKPFQFDFKFPSGIPFFNRIADPFCEAAKKAGLRVNQVQLEWSVFITDYYDRKFDGACLLVSFPSPWAPADPFDSFHSSTDVPQGGNSSGWRNAKVDKLLEDMRQEFDEGKRNAMFREFCRIFHDEQPLTLLTYSEVDVLCSSRFEDVKVRPTGLQWFDWWVKPENVRHK